jgi:hypothetical protein
MRPLILITLLCLTACTAKNGANGQDGANGERGPTGATGATGPQGVPGPAGSGFSPDGGSFQSGSRLRAKYLDGADGTKQFVTWWDSQLQIDCSFQLASDNQQRCLPIQGDPQGAWGYLVFSDTQCTVPVIMIPPAGGCLNGTPKYVSTGGGGLGVGTGIACETQSAIWAPGQPYSGPVYTQGANGGCTTFSGGVSPGTTFVTATMADPSIFVGATVQTD